MGQPSDYGSDHELREVVEKAYESDVDYSGAVHAEELIKGDSWNAKLQRLVGKIESRRMSALIRMVSSTLAP